MKNSLLLLLFFLAICSQANAQLSRYSTLPEQKIQPRTNTSQRNSNRAVEQRAAGQAAYDSQVKDCISQTKEMYESAGSYPQTISDGWHSTIMSTTVGNDCGPNSYLVENNRITKWNYEGKQYVDVTKGGVITNGKAIYYMELADGPPLYFTVYFMDDIFKR
jgi:hypothetical protein